MENAFKSGSKALNWIPNLSHTTYCTCSFLTLLEGNSILRVLTPKNLMPVFHNPQPNQLKNSFSFLINCAL